MNEKFECLRTSSSGIEESTEQLLDHKRLSDDDSFLDDASHLGTHQRRRRGRKWLLPILLQVVLIAVYTSITIALLERNNRWWRNGPHLVHSPARDAHDYQKVMFDGFFTSKNPYKGEWRPELDDAWGELLANANIVVSKEDLEKINKTSVEVPDGSGYLATLDVYHQLHCIKQIRHYLHPEHYTVDEPNIVVHIDHCLDDLRMMMMCKADISLLTYEWIPHYHKPFPVWNVEHECTNWDKINDWTTERALPMANIPVHPELMGGWIDPDTMSADAKYFLDQVRVYEADKEKERIEAFRAKAMSDNENKNNSSSPTS